MSCERVRATLAEALTGAADPASDEGHLRDCAACRDYLDGLEAIEERLRKLPLATERKPARSRSLARWTVAAAAAVFFAVLAWTFPRTPDGSARLVSGRLDVGNGDLPAGRTFTAIGDRPASLRLPDGADADLDPGARGEWTGPADGLRLLSGSGRFRAAGPPFKLETPSGRVRGAGAEFLARLDEATLAVAALSGRVSVEHDGRVFALDAGQRGVFGGPDPDARPGQDERYDRLIKKAALSLAQAVALAGAGAVEAELEEEEGRPVYAVLVARDGKLFETLIDGVDGKALGEPREKRGRKVARAGAVGLAQAVELALRNIPGTAVNAEIEEEDGKPAASVRVYAEGKVVKVHLDTATGQVLKVAAPRGGPEKREK